MVNWFIVSITLVCLPVSAYAHGGGTDANGYHAGSQPYHCHGAQDTRTGANIARQRFGGFQDIDCKDFPTQRAAQIFYETNGVHDPHGLDADNDGLACEWNP